ncbi:efflux RND transporter periplasmic adaptor subunit [Thalassotalea ganghwensis]
MLLKNKKIIPLVVISLFLLLAYLVFSNPPQSQRGRPSAVASLNVDVMTLKPQQYTVEVESYGKVKPRTQSSLLPQVSGQIIAINPNFREGGFFEQGDILIELDDRDLKAEIKIAQANLYSAKQTYLEEQAKAEQAKADWKRLGNEGEPSELVLRKPQLLAAQAKVYSAEASLAKSQLALERTKIKAPYRGRILTKSVDVGQVISPSTKLAEIYAVDYVEVRLPIKNKDLAFMELPESNRFDKRASYQPAVSIVSELTRRQEWQGRVVRTEGAFDASSQQLFVVAQIDDPYGENQSEGLPIKIGQYVNAKISGKLVDNALVIPNKTIYQGSYVYTVSDGTLKRRNIDIAWQNDEVAIVESGLSEGELLVLTPLGQVNSGTKVVINMNDGVQVETASNRNNNQPQRQQDAAKSPSNKSKGE